MSTKNAMVGEVDPALKMFDELPDSARVRVGVVAALEGCCDATIWRWVKLGLFPAPQKIGNVTTWGVGELRQARANRAAKIQASRA